MHARAECKRQEDSPLSGAQTGHGGMFFNQLAAWKLDDQSLLGCSVLTAAVTCLHIHTASF